MHFSFDLPPEEGRPRNSRIHFGPADNFQLLGLNSPLSEVCFVACFLTDGGQLRYRLAFGDQVEDLPKGLPLKGAVKTRNNYGFTFRCEGVGEF
jgi:hypothetical protein